MTTPCPDCGGTSDVERPYPAVIRTTGSLVRLITVPCTACQGEGEL